jgi:hypothetical protein
MEQDNKKAWEPMKVERVGTINEVVKQGQGKLSPPGGDPGEARKQGPIG